MSDYKLEHLCSYTATLQSPPEALRIAPRFQTAHPGYLWLNRLQCVGIGEADTRRNEASYDVYAVR